MIGSVTETKIAIIGGGPAGAATALALARLGITDVILFDAQDQTMSGERIGECIPPAATPLLSRLGVHHILAEGGHLPCPGSRSVWGSSLPGYNDFLFFPEGLGYHLSRRRFDRQLQAACLEAGILLENSARLRAISETDQAYILEFAGSGNDIDLCRARFVIDATGAGAAVLRRLGIARNLYDELISACALFQLSPGAMSEDRTLLEAAPDGWWYGARLPDDRFILSFNSELSVIKARGLGDPANWPEALAKSQLFSPDALPALVGPPISATIKAAPVAILSAVAGTHRKHGWLAVGDAASTFDPIGSAGITKALQNGIDAATAIQKWLAGDVTGLECYQAKVFAGFTSHIKNRDSLYCMETRWSNTPFWSHRTRFVRAMGTDDTPQSAYTGSTRAR